MLPDLRVQPAVEALGGFTHGDVGCVVARDFDGELIIVPLTDGVGDMEAKLYTMNETGRAIWDLLDGTRTLRQIAGHLTSEYDASADELEQEVLALAAELARLGIVVVK